MSAFCNPRLSVIPGLVPGTHASTARQSYGLHPSRSGPMGSRHKAENDVGGVL